MKRLLIILFIFCYISANAQTWTQIGQDIDGEAVNDYSGQSVSYCSDGSIVAIGAYGNDGNGVDAGHVRVYENIAGSWTQIGNDIDGEAAGDYSGVSVSLSDDGSIVAIGAMDNDGNGFGAGHVRIFQNLSGVWTQIGQDIDGEAVSDYSGTAVYLSADGSIVAIGAMENDGNGLSAGHVRIFQNLSGNWIQIGQDIDGEAAGDRFGRGLCLSDDGTIVAIGASYNDGNGAESGHVRVYENIAGTWVQIGNDIDGEAAGDYSGMSLSLSADGSIIAIGAQYNDGNGSEAGHVRIYQNQSGSWVQIGNDIDGEAASDYSGVSVSLNDDGSIVAIGAHFNDGVGYNAGHVRIYQNQSGTWTQIGNDIEGEAVEDYSGIAVSLNSNGSFVAIGTPYNDGNGSYAGHVRIFSIALPVITTHPTNQSFICFGDIIQFIVSGNYITAWEWQASNGGPWVSLSDDAVYSGTNTGTLSIVTNPGLIGYQYRCIVSNVCGLATSNTAGLNYTGVSNPVPPDNEVNVSVNQDVSWSPSSVALSYDVYFGEKGSMVFKGNQTGITYDPGILLYSNEYEWAVYPVTESGTNYCDEIWSFTTLSNSIPPEGFGVSINNTGSSPNVYAVLDLNVSTHDKGLLIPRLTTVQRTGLQLMGSSEQGLLVYDTDTDSFWFWNGSLWEELALSKKDNKEIEVLSKIIEQQNSEIESLQKRMKELERIIKQRLR